MRRKNKHQGLGEVQLIAQIKSESKILDHIENNLWPSFTQIQKDLKMDNKVLRKRINDLIKRGIIIEKLEKRAYSWIKAYRITTEEEADNFDSGKEKNYTVTELAQDKKSRREFVRDFNKKQKEKITISEYYKTHLPDKTKKGTSLRKLKKIAPYKNEKRTRRTFYQVSELVCEIMIKSEYNGQNKGKLFAIHDMKERTYESWIKRHPQLITVRKYLEKYKIKNKPLPFNFSKWGFFNQHSVLYVKRKLKNNL